MRGYFDLDAKKGQLNSLEKKTKEINFWDNPESNQAIFKKITQLKLLLDNYEELEVILDLLKENYDENLSASFFEKLNELEVKTFLNGTYDKLNCYLEIHPGAGGTESCDWASILLDMYTNYCEKTSYDLKIINIAKGDEAGIKNALIKISGEYAYGYFKNETGIHRLVRISPFDSGGKRHTSFAAVNVTPEFNNDINIEIKEEDLKIDVFHSSGAGGQSVNTTNSAVRITHLPTKIVVTCQNERSQLKNKETALKILKNKLYEKELEKQVNLEKSLKQNSKINFGNQIRSYFLEPYKLLKDHRSNFESSNPEKILAGDLNELLVYNLKNVR